MSGRALPTLPRSWTWTPLGELADVKLGKMLSPKAFEPGLLQLPYLRNENVRWFSIDTTDVKPMGFTEEERAKFQLQVGDLLVCEGGEPGRCAVVTEASAHFMIQKALHRVRPRSGAIDARFLQYCFRRFIDAGTVFERRSETTIQHLPREKMVRVPIPVAPIAEQLRIVAKIEELFSDLDAGVAALLRVRANLKRYRAAVLKAAVEGRLTQEWRTRNPATEPAAKLLERILVGRRAKGEQDQLRKFKEAGKTPPKGWKEKYEARPAAIPDHLGTLPESWAWSSIDQIAAVQGGIQKQPKRTPVKNSYPYLRVANVYRDRLVLDEMERFELFPGELERLRLEPNDLLIVEGNGSLTEIGRSAIWRGEIADCVHQNHIIRVRSVGVLATFINIYWNSPGGAKRVMTEAASTSGLYTLSVAKVRQLPVPIPPLAEQSEIVAEVDRRLSVADAAGVQVAHALQRAARLRQSILKRAFEGRLVDQDPSDEPAAVLLRRIEAGGESSGKRGVQSRAAYPLLSRRRKGSLPTP